MAVAFAMVGPVLGGDKDDMSSAALTYFQVRPVPSSFQQSAPVVVWHAAKGVGKEG
jgi:hypothetical protein